jgi:hypothetical protein
MGQYRRRLDHEHRTACRESNYALFGNAGGVDVAARDNNWGPPLTKEELRASRWWVRHSVEHVRIRCGLKGADARQEAVTWLRYMEIA